jgi:hypothetical protein
MAMEHELKRSDGLEEELRRLDGHRAGNKGFGTGAKVQLTMWLWCRS